MLRVELYVSTKDEMEKKEYNRIGDAYKGFRDNRNKVSHSGENVRKSMISNNDMEIEVVGVKPVNGRFILLQSGKEE